LATNFWRDKNMNTPQNNNNKGYGGMAERHSRRGVAAATTVNGVPTTSAPRRRGLPDDIDREQEEKEYQARYERQLLEQRQLRSNERREKRQREIYTGKVEKRTPQKVQISDANVRWMKIGILAVLTLMLFVATIYAYDKITGSRLFVLKEIDLQGTKRASREELMRLLESHQSQSLWKLDLPSIRVALERNSWVQEAEVSRVLPNALRVIVHEREPLAPWRMSNNAVVWVDREARNLGELDFNQTERVPPIISGLEEGNTEENKVANRKRMETYQQLIRDLDQNAVKLSDQIDEVNLTDLQAVRLHLVKRNLSVLVGNIEFKPRLEKALKVVDAIESKDLTALGLLKVSDAEKLVNGDRIAYLNVTHASVIVGFAP
jgi:cell division septal protein FtsQ